MGKSGLFSSAATGVSLMIASVVAMLVISAMVTFKGWPGVDSVRDSRHAVSIARVDTDAPQARQRVVLGGDSSRRGTRRPARSAATRSAKPARAGRKVGGVDGVSVAARRPTRTEQARGQVVGAPATKPAPPAQPAAPSTPSAARENVLGPVTTLAGKVAAGADGLLGATGVDATPVTDLIEALEPKNP